MATPELDEVLSNEDLEPIVQAALSHKSVAKAAASLGMEWKYFERRLKVAAERGLIPPLEPTMPGYAIKSVAYKIGNRWVKHARAPGKEYSLPPQHVVKGESALLDPDGRVIQKWVKTAADAQQTEARLRAIVDGLKDDIPPAVAITPPAHVLDDLLSQYVVTDAHIGALAWHEETGRGDWDISIAERTLVDWFAAAIAQAPASGTAVLAQLGDFLHYDSFKSVTPEHGHILDADSRYPKMVRAAIRILRQIIDMLRAKHGRVHIVMADANHDPAGEVWLRELFAVLYENEPSVTVDTSPGTFLAYEFGDVALFYHHGHRRGLKNVDSMLAGRYRDLYGRTRFAYAHTGHKHSDEFKTTDLMKVEQHETLAAPDAYGSNWLSGRSAKVIHYHKRHGEVGRNTITAAMVMQ
jgi:hypothetical protein